MGQITMGNVRKGIDAILDGNLEEIEEVFRVEKTINSMEKMLTSAPHSDQKWRCCYYSRFVTETSRRYAMSEAEYAILDHLESVCRELRTMIRTTEKGALQDVQLGDLVSCLYTALDSAVVVCDEYQSRAEAASLEELDYCEAV